MQILKEWDIEAVRRREDIKLQGSPERALSRGAYEDEKGRIYILESVFDAEKKERIAKAVYEIYYKGLPVSPYLKSKSGSFVVESGLRSYQVSNYVEGRELPRPDYVNDAWRGRALAEFILELNKNPPETDLRGVDLHDYVKNMCGKLNMHEYYEVLRNFFNSEHETAFCHGDLHPLNVIWGEERINAVIDWEFCGKNYKCYDAANLLGCVGVEHPDYLFSPFAKEFMSVLQKDSFSQELEFLPELILATRFGWLAEWLRKKDKEMEKLERAYMKYLKDNLQWLKKNLNPEKQIL